MMEDYAKQQATAIFDWIMGMPGHSFESADAAIGQITSILASVPRPEPVAWRVMVRRADTEWRQYALYETEKAAKNTLKKIEGDPLQIAVQPLYAAPASAEPVNARLLRQMQYAQSVSVDLVNQAYNDPPDYRLCVELGNALQEWQKLLPIAAESQQSKQEPVKLTDEKIEEIALSLGPNFCDHEFARAIERELNGGGE